MKKILIIDDDALFVKLIEHHLVEECFEVFKAYSGREGLSLVRSVKPDLVALDIVLPDISGWEVCQLIRQISKVPIVMLTIKEEEEDIVQALEYGADDYIAKPVGMKELIARIQAILRREEMYESLKGPLGFQRRFPPNRPDPAKGFPAGNRGKADTNRTKPPLLSGNQCWPYHQTQRTAGRGVGTGIRR